MSESQQRGRLAQVIASRGGLAPPEAPFVIEHREALFFMLCEARRPTSASPPAIMTAKNGPYLVTNVAAVRDHLGRPVQVAPQLALCRCGASAAKPFCDGTQALLLRTLLLRTLPLPTVPVVLPVPPWPFRAAPATTTMGHRRGADHHDGASSWLLLAGCGDG